MQISDYQYIITPLAAQKIRSFYRNVAKKYRNTYDYADLLHNVRSAVFSIYGIEKILPRRQPTIKRWHGYYMANTEKWYFAYSINGNTVTIIDACHAQNMHE